ncbi:hypothetical protein RI543_003391 [Arxiozyma heterogenica]|uniref:J domain-containing protein n=1 Tax=Arxiozyma heterogenica TaxID=278026 RepID=A0AAN7WLB8_9SACH|nr:hypothetical protein RI543_003391 [Kazachstania heterogenica]
MLVKQNEDLYSVLGLNVNRNANININDIRKQYKILALKYHPDKNIINKENKEVVDNKNNDLFHKISIAYEILSNEQLKVKYDQWYQNIRTSRLNMSSTRTKMIHKLNENEKNDSLKVHKKDYDLHDLQKVGQRLRKLKQLKLPYYNWDGRIISSNINNSKNNKSDDYNIDKWSDSSTIKFELKNLHYNNNNNNNNKSNFFSTINEKDLLSDLYSLLNLNENDIIDYYFYSNDDGSRDKYDNMTCLYLVLSSPKTSSQIWNKWRNEQIPNRVNAQIFINGISPRLNEDFYKKNSKFLDNNIELNSDIENLLCEPEILTETIIIN